MPTGDSPHTGAAREGSTLPAGSADRGSSPQGAPDIFLSYAHEDTARAEWVAGVLEARGWSVWFDRDLVGGARWRRLIDETLDEVGCVVVLWSAASIASNWVMDEAGEGMGRSVLVPARLEDVEIPIGFREAQAIDLVEGRVPLDEAESALVTAVATVLGKPKIEPPTPSRLTRLLRRETPLALALLPVAFALPLLLRPASGTVIDLTVTVTEVAFASTREQDLTDRAVVTALETWGLESIHFPRTRAAAERVVSATAGRPLSLRLDTDAEPATGSITVEGLRVAEGTRVNLAVPDSGSVRISLTGETSPIGMSVDGVLRTGQTAGDMEPTNFGTPRLLSVTPDPRGVDIVLRRIAEPRLASLPVRVEELSLARIDETLGTTRSTLAVVSTIRSGTVRFDAPDGPERAIGSGERIRTTGSAGEIRELTLTGDALRLRYQGTVRSFDSCTADNACESWMPSTLESLVARRLPVVLAAAALYALLLFLLTRRRFRRTGRLAAIALAVGAMYPATASAQTATGSNDPEESARHLVVRIESGIGFGSGIIVGARSDTLFIATANHVVRRGGTAADSIDLRFYWSPQTSVKATLLANADDSLDLALLAVTPLSRVPPVPTPSASAEDAPGSIDPGEERHFDPRTIPFDRLGDLDALERGDAIWLLGMPNGLPWRINSSPERFIDFRGASLDFESNLLARGHSGGALLNEDREVIGMLKSDQAPYGEAVSLYAIARQVEAWGYPVDLRLRAPQLATGEGRACVLTSRGETRCMGYDDRYESGPIHLDMRLKRLSLRHAHACGIAAGGRAFCVGNNSNGQLGDGTLTARYDAPAEVAGGLTFESISAGSGHTCGVVSGGDVYCWGLAEGGQLGAFFVDDRTTPTRVPTTARFRSVSAMWQYTCALTIEGAAWCWGAVAAVEGRQSPPTRFAPDLTFDALTAGWYQACGLTDAGQAWCWGFNDDGQLGTGAPDEDYHDQPRPVAGSHSFTGITSGVAHTCGVTAGGEAWCWGLNNFGQLGNGSTEDSAVPVRVGGNHVFEAVSAGDLFTCGLTPDSEVWCWGDNSIVGSHEGGYLPGGEDRYTGPVLALSLDPSSRRPWRR